MKKHYFTLFSIFCTVFTTSIYAQNVMVIEKADNTSIKVGVDDIKQIYFEFMDSQSANDTLNTIYKQMYTSGWSTIGNAHQSFGITSYALCADLMGEDNIMANSGSGWFWYDAIYEVKKRYTTKNWRSYDLWNAYYTWISKCNTIITGQDKMGGNEDDIQNIVGQAYAIRAYSYFMLSQFFSRTIVGHENEPCVPIYTEPITPNSEGHVRSTNAEVYAQIDKDINKASDLLKGKERPQWLFDVKIRIDYAVAQAIKSRICMVENKWEEAKIAAHNAIDNSGCKVLPVSSFIGLNIARYDSDNVMWGAAIEYDKVGMYASLFSHMEYEGRGYANNAPKCINKELYAKMSQTDTRRDWWKSGLVSGEYVQEKFKFLNSSSWEGDYIFMRIEEMYLTAAEAECRLGEEEAAKNDLMAVMSQRDPEYNTTKTGTALGKTSETANETGSLLEEILIQRRIELWGEFGRMFDLKRLKQGFVRTTEMGWPESALIPNVSTSDPESYCNVLTIPQSEFDWNKNLDIEKDQNPLGDYPN